MRSERLENNTNNDREPELDALVLGTYISATDYLGIQCGLNGQDTMPHGQTSEQFVEYMEATNDHVITIDGEEDDFEYGPITTQSGRTEAISIRRIDRYTHIQRTVTDPEVRQADVEEDHIILAPDGTLAGITACRGDNTSPRNIHDVSKQLRILNHVKNGIDGYVRYRLMAVEQFADEAYDLEEMSELELELADLEEAEHISGDFSVVLQGSGIALGEVKND